jgi:ubiquinone/menaquinone biosynthesis C-methylase UbiE
MMSNAVWAKNIHQEIAFWEGVIRRTAASQSGAEGPSVQDYSWLRRTLVPPPADNEVMRLLDVGSGPFSTLGRAKPGNGVEIVRADALGDAYNRILEECGLAQFPSVLAIKGEELSLAFGHDAFHFVNCANALDHFEDPARSFLEMVRVCKPGGIVRIISIENEGEREAYAGLHQWNLQTADNGLWLWNRATRTNLIPLCRLAVSYDWKYVDHGQTGFNIFEATIRKLNPSQNLA